jgi:carbamoyl-phosphate synthase large subunit
LKRANVLVTGVGGIVGQAIVKCLKIANARKQPYPYYNIIGVDASSLSAGLYLVDKGAIVPNAREPEFIRSIIDVIERYDVEAVFIGTDQELKVISENKTEIEEQTGVKILVSPAEVIEIARDKWNTFKFLRNKDFPCPDSALPQDLKKFVSTHDFPLVVKPREGFGSVEFHVSNSVSELKQSIVSIERVGWRPIIQEYLGPNDEFTTGVCVDFLRKEVMSSISIKKFLKNGQTYKAFIDDFSEVRVLSERIALALGVMGAVNIQSKISDGINKVFEINPRLSATCAMRAAAGINEPDLLFRNIVLGEAIRLDDYKKLVCMRYWEEISIEKEKYKKSLEEWNVGTDFLKFQTDSRFRSFKGFN